MARLTVEQATREAGSVGSGATSLNLSHRALSDVSCLSSFSDLERLDLGYNCLVTLEGLSSCVNLKWLSVIENKLVSLKGVESLSKLQVLNAGKNKLTRMDEVKSLTSLGALILNDNNISSICKLDRLLQLGGEEMDFLQQQGIRVEVIPGITSASGIAVELGIPLTHRGVANSVRFLTGHSRNGGTDPLYVAENAADPDTTLVVYMGFPTLPSLAPKLLKHGLPPDTPAVAVERGITPQQQTVFAVLKDLVNEVKSADLVSSTLIIIGKVVALSPFWVESSEQDALRIENSLATEGKKIAVFPVSNADRSRATSHLRYEQFQFRLVV